MDKVRRIEVRARHIVREQTAGLWHASFKGSGIEFAEVREFQEGDDVRAVDWKLMARLGRPYVKRFIEEREQTILLLVDGSASGHFSSTGVPRAETLAELSAVIALSAAFNQDKVGLTLFTDHDEVHLPPARGQHHVLRVVREILAHDCTSPRTDLAGAIQRLHRATSRRAVVFIISDFLDPGFRVPLRLLAQKHEVILLHMTDPLEESWPRLGPGVSVRLEGLEDRHQAMLTGRRAKAWARANRGEDGDAKTLRRDAHAMRADHVALSTDEDYLPALLAYLRLRGNRR